MKPAPPATTIRSFTPSSSKRTVIVLLQPIQARFGTHSGFNQSRCRAFAQGQLVRSGACECASRGAKYPALDVDAVSSSATCEPLQIWKTPVPGLEAEKLTENSGGWCPYELFRLPLRRRVVRRGAHSGLWRAGFVLAGRRGQHLPNFRGLLEMGLDSGTQSLEQLFELRI